MTKPTGNEVATIDPYTQGVLDLEATQAERALEAAETVPEIREVLATAKALRTYAKERGLGVADENRASEVIYRAERKGGLELIRMAQSGERATGRPPAALDYQGRSLDERIRAGRASAEARSRDDLVLLSDLGISEAQARSWQALGRLDDETFEEVITKSREKSDRLARVDFYRQADRAYGIRPQPADPNAWRSEKAVGTFVGDTSGPEPFAVAWATVQAGVRILEPLVAQGWPGELEYTPEGWTRFDAELNAAGKLLLTIQKRAAGYPRKAPTALPDDE